MKSARLAEVTRDRSVITAELESARHIDYPLDPGLLDSALQAAVLWNEGSQTRLPFSARSVRIFGPTSARSFAVLTQHRAVAGETADSLDVEICDLTGRVSVRLSGLITRVLGTDSQSPRTAVVLARRAWRASASIAGTARNACGRTVLLHPQFTHCRETLQREAHVDLLRVSADDASQIEPCAIQLLQQIRVESHERTLQVVLPYMEIGRASCRERV